jgi:hypothetical protein
MKALALITAATVLCVAAWAGPAPWYKWHSQEADYEVCAQVSPGDGWVKVKGPFEDSKCRKILRK